MVGPSSDDNEVDDWGYYVLSPDGRTVIPCSREVWAEWMFADPRPDRHVALTSLGPITISTVFLGMDHNMPFPTKDSGMPHVPHIFETLVTYEGHELDMRRYSTWDEAAAGHERAVHQLPGYAREAHEMELDSYENPTTIFSPMHDPE